MNNRIALIIVLALGIVQMFAQKNTWTLGLCTGVQGNINTVINQEYYGGSYESYFEENEGRWNPTRIYLEHVFSQTPPVELTAKYNTGKYFSIALSVGYRSYYLKVKDNMFYNYTERYDYIQIPIIFQCDIPLKKKGFTFFVQGGIGFDIEVGDRGWGYYFGEYYDHWIGKTCTVENTTENYWGGGGGFIALLHGGFGFSYKFNSGVGISLLGRYNLGSDYISQHSYHTIVKEVGTGIVEREIKEQLFGKAESWNVLLGVTYTFKPHVSKSKNKEQQ